MALATLADVEARFGRELTSDEQVTAATLLEDAEALILQKVPDLLTRTDLERLAVIVECNAVIRVLRNPEGYLSETDGNYSYQRAANGPLGAVSINPDEWELLGVRRGFIVLVPDTSIDPQVP